MTTCKLCLGKHKLIKAHAIPEAFFRELRSDGQTPQLITTTPSSFPKRVPIGVYDDQILCELCEAKFEEIDSYGIDALLKKFNDHFHPIEVSRPTEGLESETIDPQRLLQFLVAILWRASVSNHPFFSKVSLGPYEQAASLSANRSSVIIPAVFDAILCKWKKGKDTENLPTTAILDPTSEKLLGIRVYRVYLGEITAFIKVDSKPFPLELKTVGLQSGTPIRIIPRDMSKSKDLKVMQYTAQTAYKIKLNFQKSRSKP